MMRRKINKMSHPTYKTERLISLFLGIQSSLANGDVQLRESWKLSSQVEHTTAGFTESLQGVIIMSKMTPNKDII